MQLENEVFKRRKANITKLLKYGFRNKGKCFLLEKALPYGNLLARISVSDEGHVDGKIIDQELGNEYIAFRANGVLGNFASGVFKAYRDLLEDIAEKAFEREDFLLPQTNRIVREILKRYGVKPEFLWAKYPGYAVLRNVENDKWFGLVLDVPKGKIISNSEGQTEILDVKLDEHAIGVPRKGILPAYHLNKKKWIGILMEDILSDSEVLSLIDRSYQNNMKHESWLIPANPKYYDIFKAFERSDTIIWKQDADIHKGDKAFLYIGAPYSTIFFQCLVLETNIPYEGKSKHVRIDKVMKIRLVKRYGGHEFDIEKLRHLGMTSVRSQRKIRNPLLEELEKNRL